MNIDEESSDCEEHHDKKCSMATLSRIAGKSYYIYTGSGNINPTQGAQLGSIGSTGMGLCFSRARFSLGIGIGEITEDIATVSTDCI
jgi:hypothetical protein